MSTALLSWDMMHTRASLVYTEMNMYSEQEDNPYYYVLLHDSKMLARHANM